MTRRNPTRRDPKQNVQKKPDCRWLGDWLVYSDPTSSRFASGWVARNRQLTSLDWAAANDTRGIVVRKCDRLKKARSIDIHIHSKFRPPANRINFSHVSFRVSSSVRLSTLLCFTIHRCTSSVQNSCSRFETTKIEAKRVTIGSHLSHEMFAQQTVQFVTARCLAIGTVGPQPDENYDQTLLYATPSPKLET